MLTDLGAMIAPIGAAIEVAALNILLGADNAVLIALACQPLTVERRKRVLVSGVVGAVAFRFVLSVGAVTLLASLPGLRLTGAVILIVIAMHSLTDFHQRAAGMESLPDNDRRGSSRLDSRFWQAVLAVIATDAVMSLDNIVATAAVAQGSAGLILFGLVLSIPAVMFGSFLLTQVFDEWPILRLSGAVLLGWIAGQMAAADVLIGPWMARETPALANLLPALCACYVYVVGHGATVIRCRAEAQGS